jgi:hypothetical protein
MNRSFDACVSYLLFPSRPLIGFATPVCGGAPLNVHFSVSQINLVFKQGMIVDILKRAHKTKEYQTLPIRDRNGKVSAFLSALNLIGLPRATKDRLQARISDGRRAQGSRQLPVEATSGPSADGRDCLLKGKLIAYGSVRYTLKISLVGHR